MNYLFNILTPTLWWWWNVSSAQHPYSIIVLQPADFTFFHWMSFENYAQTLVGRTHSSICSTSRFKKKTYPEAGQDSKRFAPSKVTGQTSLLELLAQKTTSQWQVKFMVA